MSGNTGTHFCWEMFPSSRIFREKNAEFKMQIHLGVMQGRQGLVWAELLAAFAASSFCRRLFPPQFHPLIGCKCPAFILMLSPLIPDVSLGCGVWNNFSQLPPKAPGFGIVVLQKLFSRLFQWFLENRAQILRKFQLGSAPAHIWPSRELSMKWWEAQDEVSGDAGVTGEDFGWHSPVYHWHSHGNFHRSFTKAGSAVL